MTDADDAEYPARIPREDLLDDLQWVADKIGHSPSSIEYKQHGEHYPGTFQYRFGSWNEAKREAGMETYDANSERPDYQSILRESGPSTLSGFPDPLHITELRRSGHNIRRFSVSVKGQSPVYYLPDTHSPAEVVQEWVDEHDSIVSSMSVRALHSRISKKGDEWKRASRDILGELDGWDVGRDTSAFHNEDGQGGECPLCGEEYSSALPDHLPCDGGESDD